MVPVFNETNLEGICNALGDTSTGLSGSEIGNLLLRLNIADPFPSITKRKRLFEALRVKQHKDNCGNYIVPLFMKQ